MKSNTTNNTHLWVKSIKAEDLVKGYYLARAKRVGRTKNGDPFLSITLSDRTGDVEARVWERAEEFTSLFKEGNVIYVEGQGNLYRNRVQLTLTSLKAGDGGGDPSIFLEKTEKNVKKMMEFLRSTVDATRNSHLKALINNFLADHHFVSLFKTAPAAKNFHHNYIGGLLEHTVAVCRMAGAVADHYPELDRDLLMAGAILHDIGKTREFKFDTHIDYSDEGRLLGHLTLGVAMVDDKLAALKTFPVDLALRLKHLILSHHGQYDFGSPKRPKFLEAFALHLIDDLDAKMNGLGRFMGKDPHEGVWTDFNKLFQRYFLKGAIPGPEEKKSPIHNQDDRQKVLFSPLLPETE